MERLDISLDLCETSIWDELSMSYSPNLWYDKIEYILKHKFVEQPLITGDFIVGRSDREYGCNLQLSHDHLLMRLKEGGRKERLMPLDYVKAEFFAVGDKYTIKFTKLSEVFTIRTNLFHQWA